MNSVLKIKTTLKDYVLEKRKINLFEPRINQNCAEYFKVKGFEKTIKIFIYKDYLILDMVCETPVLFSINSTDQICGTNIFFKRIGKLDFYTNNLNIESIEKYIEVLKLDFFGLSLKSDEALYVYRNRVQLLISDKRELLDELSLLKRIQQKIGILDTNQNYW